MSDNRFKQAHKEARWSFGLAIAYLALWVIFAYGISGNTGFLGFPLWFELSCLILPLIFIFLCWLMIRFIFKNISLED